MDTAFEWTPEPVLLEKVIALANQRGQSPEAIVDQAVAVYVQIQSHSQPELSRGQELINLMRGKATAKLTTDEIMCLNKDGNDLKNLQWRMRSTQRLQGCSLIQGAKR